MQAPDEASSPPPFVLRIVSIDSYMSKPVPGLDVCYSALEGTAIDLVPVMRIFGATPAGQKACLHVHQVFGVHVGSGFA